MRTANVLVLLVVGAVITGCKLEINVPPGGRVVTESRSFSCGAGETCTIDISDIFFDETFRALPDPGYTFVSWRERLFGFCGNRYTPCRLTTNRFEGTPFMSILEGDYLFYLQPVFASLDGWAELARKPRAAEGAASCVIGGKLYVVGKHRGEVGEQWPVAIDEYDPVTNTWRERAANAAGQSWATADAVGGKCYVIGWGEDLDEPRWAVQAYDPLTNTWQEEPHERARVYPGARSAAINGKIYRIGGLMPGYWSPPTPIAAVEIYDPDKKQWQSGADMPTPRYGAAVAALGGYVYAAGGSWGPDVVERYDPTTNQWASVANLPDELEYAAAVAYRGRLYVSGGINSEGTISNLVYRYDPNTDQWEIAAVMPTPRVSHTIAVIDGQIYLVGGSEPYDGTDSEVLTTYLYTPAAD